MDTPRTPRVTRLVSIVPTLVILGLAVLGWRWVGGLQPQSGTPAGDRIPASVGDSPALQAAREQKAQPGDVDASVGGFVNEYADHFGHEATALNVTILNASLVKDGPPVTIGSHFMSDAPDATGMDAAQLNFAYTGSIS